MDIPDGQEARENAARIVNAGGIIGFRTDTFYGLGVDPFNRDALRALNELKGREGKPILVLIADETDAERLVEVKTSLFPALCAKHWPGALTLVSFARREVTEELTAGTGTVGVRLPNDAEVRALVRAVGGALTATSANIAGEPPARNAADVARYFGGRLDLIIDGGECRTEQPSTVLDITRDPPVLIREGVVSRVELSATLESLGVALG